MNYFPQHFDVSGLSQAKKATLFCEFWDDVEDRWNRETPYLCSLICKNVALDRDSLVVDYGCGVGRIAKMLIEKVGCRVIGVDISASMRSLSAAYVNNDKFFACSRDASSLFSRSADLILSIWVLQHVFDPSEDLMMIKNMIKPSGKLFVLNNDNVPGLSTMRVVPTSGGWNNDGIDIEILIEQFGFNRTVRDRMSTNVVPERLSRGSFWALYQLKKGKSDASHSCW